MDTASAGSGNSSLSLTIALRARAPRPLNATLGAPEKPPSLVAMLKGLGRGRFGIRSIFPFCELVVGGEVPFAGQQSLHPAHRCVCLAKVSCLPKLP